MSRLERQPLRGEKMDEEDRTGDLVEAATLELEAMVEGASVVDMVEGVKLWSICRFPQIRCAFKYLFMGKKHY